ncbi:MAG: restriction endonuclease subunit S [Saprospiraceae bacterium]
MKKAYPTYKETDLPWVSNVPEHWQPIMNKYLFKLKKSEVGDKSGDFALLSLTLRGVIKRDMDNPKGKFPAEFNTYQKVRRGDLIFCLFDIEETPRTVGISPYDGMITGAYTVFESKPNLLNTFACYYYLFLDKKKSLSCFYRGLRKTISKETFSAIKLPLPTLPEQRQIAAYLDHKCALIDTFIAKKKRLIELLQEQKQAIINQAVTRGIDPDVPLKPSGVDWLGDIPAHWEVIQLRRLVNNMEQGWSPQCENRIATTREWAVMKVGCVNGSQFNPDEHKALPANLEPRLEYELKEGDVLISRANTRELVGSTSIVKSVRPKLLLCDKLYRLNIKKSIDRNFLVHSLRSHSSRIQIGAVATGASDTMQNISQGKVLSIWIGLPKLDEQVDIFNLIEKELKLSNQAILKIQKELTLIQEYKTTLIAEAVTGKIDVRNWKAEQENYTGSPQKQEVL